MARRSHALRSSHETGAFRLAMDPYARFAAECAQVPLSLDPAARGRSVRHNTVYYGCQVDFQDLECRPDLGCHQPRSLDARSVTLVSSGGIIGDNLGQFYGEVVFAIAPWEIQRGLIWAGTNDGQVWYTKDGGGNWTNVSKNIAGLPPWGTVRKIEPSHFDPATAYIAIDFHMVDDREPFIYKTTDFGQTWTKVTGDLPASIRSTTRCRWPRTRTKGDAVRRHRPRLLLLARRRRALEKFKAGLPRSAVCWISCRRSCTTWWCPRTAAECSSCATSRRSSRAARSANARRELFRRIPVPSGAKRPSGGHVREGGAQRPARIEILDSANKVVRTLNAPTRAGYNRVTWDLRYDRAAHARCSRRRPTIRSSSRSRASGIEDAPDRALGTRRSAADGPLALAGTYTVRLTVNGKTEQPLTILRDPEIKTNEADLVAAARRRCASATT